MPVKFVAATIRSRPHPRQEEGEDEGGTPTNTGEDASRPRAARVEACVVDCTVPDPRDSDDDFDFIYFDFRFPRSAMRAVDSYLKYK
jgi:hypothetical protein